MIGLPDRLDRCCLDDSPAVAIYAVPGGCVATDLEVQPLCAQHEHSLPDGAWNYGEVELLVDLVPGWPA